MPTRGFVDIVLVGLVACLAFGTGWSMRGNQAQAQSEELEQRVDRVESALVLSRTKLARTHDALIAAELRNMLATAELHVATGAYEDAARQVVQSAIRISELAPRLRSTDREAAMDLGMQLALMGEGVRELGPESSEVIAVASSRVDDVLRR